MKKLLNVKPFIVCALLLVTGLLLTAQPALAQSDNHSYLPLTMSATEGQSGIQLIEQAKETDTISDEQALIYKVQAVVGDPALPSQYRGYEPHQDGTSVMNEALDLWDTLSPATQAILAPYLRAPSESDSWIALNEPAPTAVAGAVTPAGATALTWETINAANGKAKIWYHPEYPGDGARAQKIAAELQRHIWPKLTGMFREPLPDCGASCVQGGGDLRVDIYIAHIDRSYVRRFQRGTKGEAAYMVLEPDASYATVAHELMHMIQFAYPLISFREYEWILESTAQWAMDFVYPTDNADPDFPRRHEEQEAALAFLGDTHLSLEHVDDEHEYGSYLYWFFLRSPEIVITVLQSMSQPNSLQNVNAATAGGFENAWPNFALYNWNKTPVEYYQQWDELKEFPSSHSKYYIGPSEEPFPISVNHLAARYYRFRFDDNVRRVQVQLPVALRGVETAHVWAMLKTDGLWREPENWTEISEKVFCRDNPGENVEEIVLIITNSNWQDRSHVLAPGDGTITTFSSCGCQEADLFQEWTGAATLSYNKTASDQDTTAESDRQAQLSFRLTRQPDTAFDNYRWEGDPIAGSTASVNDEITSDSNTFTWIGNKIMPDTKRIRLEINPATCRYEIWVGVFVDAIYDYGTGEQQEIQHIEYRVYDIPVPEGITGWSLTGSRTVPVQVGGGNEGVDRLFTGPGAMGQLDHLLDGELGTAPVTWSFTPVEPE